MLAAFGRRFFHSLIAKLAIAPADGLDGIVHVASPCDVDAGAGISHRRIPFFVSAVSSCYSRAKACGRAPIRSSKTLLLYFRRPYHPRNWIAVYMTVAKKAAPVASFVVDVSNISRGGPETALWESSDNAS